MNGTFTTEKRRRGRGRERVVRGGGRSHRRRLRCQIVTKFYPSFVVCFCIETQREENFTSEREITSFIIE
jgi:hypothetical protein